jgi:hypothetical protein
VRQRRSALNATEQQRGAQPRNIVSWELVDHEALALSTCRGRRLTTPPRSKPSSRFEMICRSPAGDLTGVPYIARGVGLMTSTSNAIVGAAERDGNGTPNDLNGPRGGCVLTTYSHRPSYRPAHPFASNIASVSRSRHFPTVPGRRQAVGHQRTTRNDDNQRRQFDERSWSNRVRPGRDFGRRDFLNRVSHVRFMPRALL